jgi:hypothetical protein
MQQKSWLFKVQLLLSMFLSKNYMDHQNSNIMLYIAHKFDNGDILIKITWKLDFFCKNIERSSLTSSVKDVAE